MQKRVGPLAPKEVISGSLLKKIAFMDDFFITLISTNEISIEKGRTIEMDNNLKVNVVMTPCPISADEENLSRRGHASNGFT